MAHGDWLKTAISNSLFIIGWNERTNAVVFFAATFFHVKRRERAPCFQGYVTSATSIIHVSFFISVTWGQVTFVTSPYNSMRKYSNASFFDVTYHIDPIPEWPCCTMPFLMTKVQFSWANCREVIKFLINQNLDYLWPYLGMLADPHWSGCIAVQEQQNCTTVSKMTEDMSIWLWHSETTLRKNFWCV